MRTLAFAHADLPADTPADEDAVLARKDRFEGGLTFAGWVGIRAGALFGAGHSCVL